MQLKNFYINCEIDGWKSKLAGGPRAEDGGFNLIIYQRSRGESVKVLEVEGYANSNGRLTLEICKHENFFLVNSIKEALITNR